jgi:hypothetical protein
VKSPADVILTDLALMRGHWQTAVLAEDRTAETLCMDRIDALLERLSIARKQPAPTHL